VSATAPRNRIVQEDLEEIVSQPLDWDAFAGRTVLVSGANGFLPTYMVETLLFLNERRRGFACKVVGLVRSREKAERRFRHHLDRDDLRLLLQDVAEPIAQIDGPVDYVVHAASQASPKYYGKDPVGTLGPNVFGTRNMLDLARTKRSRGLLFFSSGEVYGSVPPAQIPTKETQYGYVDPVAVRSCYAESKRMGENMCASWAAQHGVPAKIARPFHTYGPGMLLDDGRVFSDFVADIVHGRDIQMKSDGSAMRAYCYLADAVRGFFTVLLAGKAGEAYNVGNELAHVTVLELAEILVGLYPEKNLKVVRAPATQSPGYLKSPLVDNCPDTSKLSALGWTPSHSIASGFRRTIESFS
jgi:UDP-glucuronate decarboxylase